MATPKSDFQFSIPQQIERLAQAINLLTAAQAAKTDADQKMYLKSAQPILNAAAGEINGTLKEG